MNVTKHATQRSRQRLGISKKAVDRNAKAAFEKGVTHGETSGSLHRYLTSLFFHNRSANNMRLYNQHVYIFADETLITVFPIPAKYRSTAERLQRKRCADGKDCTK